MDTGTNSAKQQNAKAALLCLLIKRQPTNCLFYSVAGTIDTTAAAAADDVNDDDDSSTCTALLSGCSG